MERRAPLKLAIARLPWVLVGIAAALEGVTVAILPFVSSLPADGPVSKPPESGLFLGYVGMLTAILLVNLFGKYLSAEKFSGRLPRIHNPLLVSIWGGIYLALIFLFQAVFDFSPYTTPNVMLRAACALAVSTLVVLVLYRVSVARFAVLSLTYSLGERSQRILAASIVPVVVLASLYEAIALPIIELVRDIEHYRFLAGLLLGAVSGALATACAVALYNSLARVYPGGRLFLTVENID